MIKLAVLIFAFASLLVFSALFSRDMLILQVLFLLANLLFLISSIIFQIPIMIMINIGYILVNIYQIIRLTIERSDISIPLELRSAYHQLFYNMYPREFLSLVKLGTKKLANPGEYIYHKNEEKDILSLTIEGDVRIKSREKHITTLSAPVFLGEMRYLTHKPISSDVIAVNKTTCLQWDFNTLNDLMKKNASAYLKLSEVLGRDLVLKVQHSMEA